MSLKGRLRRLEAGVRWLETEGVLRRWELRWKIAEKQRAIAEFRARPKAKAVPQLRVVPTLRDAVVPAAPQGEGVRVPAAPQAEAVHARAQPPPPALPPPPPAPEPGQPTVPVSPDMQIRPVFWRQRTAQDYYEDEEAAGTNGRCLTEYDPLAGDYDDEE